MMTGYDVLNTGAAWVDLSARGKIRITGEDRARLLHAISTNDIANLQPGGEMYAFFLNSQGRILCDAYIHAFAEHILVDTEPETGAKLLAHLDQYIIADDVSLEDETTSWACIGILGGRAEEVAAGITIPAGGFVSRAAGVRIFFAKGQVPDLSGIPQASEEAARVYRLENGIPRYGEDITERYLVQETGQMQAVHSNKGCYLGQEIVERVRSRAQIHRVLMPVRIKSQAVPAPGTKLMADGKAAAEITSAAYSPLFNEVVALAYVRTEAAQNKPPLYLDGVEPPVEAYLP